MKAQNTAIDELLSADQPKFLSDWLAEAAASGGSAAAASGLAGEAKILLKALQEGLRAGGDAAGFDSVAWAGLRDALAALSSSRAAQGASVGDTSHFVLAIKKPIFTALQQRQSQAQSLMESVPWTSTLADKMAQFTVTIYQRSREDIIRRQQQELLELSTPVIKLWEGVLAVPMIGTLDSSRTQLVMEALLQRIVETGSELAIIDITGVPTVDTLVAQHLLKTVTAIRLMGADCIISKHSSADRPDHRAPSASLLQGIVTKASLADALALALKTSGYVVTRPKV